MMKGSFLCAIAVLGLVSMGLAESKEKFPSQAMFGAKDLARMEQIEVKYCSKGEIEHRRAFCDKVTDDDYRSTCEDLFNELVELCDEHLDKIVAETFEPELLEDLWREFDFIEDEVARPLDETLRANLETYFGYTETYWDNEYCDTDVSEILDKCHSFVVSYQPIKTFMNLSGKKSLLEVEDEKAEEVFQIFEFCRAFTKHYDTKSKDSHLYSDEVAKGLLGSILGGGDAETPFWRRPFQGLF